jgi:hypothetical protein
MIATRAYGIHSSRTALALVMLPLDPTEYVLPYERLPRERTRVP